MRKIILIIMLFGAWCVASACTSMLVPARSSATGRSLMWKHRDTGAEQNFIARVDGGNGRYGYVGLYNGGDSLLAEAWMGMNDAGLAIMNTASYNLAPDTASYKDKEGRVMSMALARCATVDDFAAMLDTLPRPMGIQANFGVMDALGGMAYIEADDHGYVRYDIGDEPYMIRTNYSYSGNDRDGMGYIRYQNALDILRPEIEAGEFAPWSFTERASRSFWHSKMGRDFESEDVRWVVDQDFIPRNISSASIVIEGANGVGDAAGMKMWTMIGYPPCSHVQLVTLTDIPAGLQPHGPLWRSPDCEAVVAMKRRAFPTRRGNGQRYIDMDYLRAVMPAQRQLSLKAYGLSD